MCPVQYTSRNLILAAGNGTPGRSSVNAKVDTWRTPKEKPRASLGGPGCASMFEGPDQELATQLERYTEVIVCVPEGASACHCNACLSTRTPIFHMFRNMLTCLLLTA